MSGSDPRTDGDLDRIGYPAAGVRRPHPRRSPALETTVVRHDARPDRATVHPRGLTGLARMETWLSVDRSAVVDLAAWR